MKKTLQTLTLICLLTTGLFGQDSIGYIKIYVYDKKTKNPILDSFTVNLTDGVKSNVYKMKPDTDGNVEIKFLTVNKYNISLSAPGYQTLQVKKVIVNGIHTTYLRFPLTPISAVKTNKRKRKKN